MLAIAQSWERLGRPLHPCEPVQQMAAALEKAHPKTPQGWWANDDHYHTSYPEDHTPFALTEWPIQCPRWVVFALDAMPGRDLPEKLLATYAAYWVREARAGRFKALKYLIFHDRIYTTWAGFEGERYFGEWHSHVHLSFRTDYETKGFGAWSPIPGEDDMDPSDRIAWNGPQGDRMAKLDPRLDRRGLTVAQLFTYTYEYSRGAAAAGAALQAALKAEADARRKAEAAEATRDETVRLALATVTATLATAGGDAGVAAALTAIGRVRDDLIDRLSEERAAAAARDAEQTAALARLEAQVAEANAEADSLRAQLAAGAQAEADALALTQKVAPAGSLREPVKKAEPESP